MSDALTLSEVLLAVVSVDFHLEHLVLAEKGGHLGRALSAGAPDPHQQHVAPGLADDSHHAGNCGRERIHLPLFTPEFPKVGAVAP